MWWEIVAATVALLLAVYGAADLVARVCWRLVFAGERESLILTVAAGRDAEYRIRRLAAWVRLCPNGGFTPTVVLTEENESLMRLCEQLGLICKIALQEETDTL